MARHWAAGVVLVVGLATGVAAPATAQEPKLAPAAGEAAAKVKPAPEAAADPGLAGVGKAGVTSLLTRLNPMILVLGLCSVVTIGYALERTIALRRSRVIPREFVDRFMERLASGKLDRDRAMELCRANDSVVARVFGHAVRYWGMPAATIRQAVEHDAAGEVVEMKRNIRVLNGAATLAPLLGLLGTVFGMIESFDSLKTAVGGKSEALAHGISLALASTAIGLSIAALAVAMYYFLLNRVDVLVKSVDDQARRVIELVSNESIRPAPTGAPGRPATTRGTSRGFIDRRRGNPNGVETMLSRVNQADESPHINMTPMVDVVLCLLIFFMTATRLHDWDEQEFVVKVPEVSDAAPLTAAPEDLTVSVTAPGEVKVGDKTLDLDELAALLTEARGRYADQGVLIRGDAKLDYQDLADVLSVCNAAEIKNVRLPVRPREPKPKSNP